MKFPIPGQNIRVDVAEGVDPTWYERFAKFFGVLDTLVARGGYVEGSYTPVLTSAGTVPTFTAVPLAGTYYKIGRLCVVYIVAENTAGGTPGAGANQLAISLPFPVQSGANRARVSSGSALLNGTDEGLVFLESLGGASSATMWQQTVSGSKVNQVALNCADLNNAVRALHLSFTYPVN